MNSKSRCVSSPSAVNRYRSGLIISTSGGQTMSAAVTTPELRTSRVRWAVSTSSSRSRTCLRWRMIWVMSSRRPGTAENSWATSVTRTEVMAAPGSEASSTRRRAFPMVMPYPFSRGLMMKRPYLRVLASASIFGSTRLPVALLVKETPPLLTLGFWVIQGGDGGPPPPMGFSASSIPRSTGR